MTIDEFYMNTRIKKMNIHYDSRPDHIENIIGGDSSNPTWEEYIKQYKLEYRPYIIGLKKSILEANLQNTRAAEICNQTWWQSEDGKVSIVFSWRAWGDLLQAIHNKCEGYMKYYM